MTALPLLFALFSLPTINPSSSPDLPPIQVTDLAWLPPRSQVERARQWNQLCQDGIAERINCPSRDAVLAILRDNYAPWDTLGIAQFHGYLNAHGGQPDWRVEEQQRCVLALERLRGLIGPEAYYSGQLPESVPRELLQEVGP